MSRSPYIRAMIGSLRDRIATWCQDFLTQALSIGSDAFKTVLADQGKIWADACARYRTGVPGYKRDLAADVASIHQSRTRPARQSRPG